MESEAAWNHYPAARTQAGTARTAARFLRDGRLENCVNKQFLVVTG